MATKNENSLAPVQGTQLAEISTDILTASSGLELLDDLKSQGVDEYLALKPADLKMPRFRLMQPTSLEVTKGTVPAGHFYNPVTGEAVKELPCILLSKNESRVMWEKTFKSGEKPLCRSVDGKVSSSDSRKLCEKCPHSKWDNNASENKPQCNMAYGWLALSQLDTSMNLPFRIVIPGASVKFTKDFFTTIAPMQLAPFAHRVTLISEFTSNEKGNFYVIKYKRTGNLILDMLKDFGWTIEEVKADPAKNQLFQEKKLQTWKHFEGIAQTYMKIFKEATEMDLTDSDNVIVAEASAEVPQEGAMF